MNWCERTTWRAKLRLALQGVLLLGLPLGAGAAAALPAKDLEFFEARIRPLLADKCYSCHSKQADKVRGGLLLDSSAAVLHGGNTGPALVPGKPDDSLLIQAVRYKDEDLQMPPKGEKLTDQQIADLTEWVRRGAPDPRTGAARKGAGVGRSHWSFQPVQKPAVPVVKQTEWVRNPIDNFVLSRLEEAGMKPNSPAAKTTLIRRVYFDLIGMPPTARDVQAFVNDESPDAFEKVVDRLLALPQYGEHWARYWLDVARYSDTKGDPPKQEDARYPHAWTYRDWVIEALNADMPYNNFIVAQLAGDKLQAALEKQAKDKNQPPPANRWPVAALGFLTLGNQFDGRRDDIIADQIDVTTKAFLGLTVACARCHDHKFDPIPTKDYYSLYGVFANTMQPKELPTLEPKVPKTEALMEYLTKTAALAKREAEIEQQQREFRAARRKDPEKRRELIRLERELHRDVGNLECEHPGAPARVNVLLDVPRPKDFPVLLRGETNNKGETVPRRFLEILSEDPKKRPTWRNGSGRLELALAIADAKNPLTARVLVNRIWQNHWGTGFVPTPDDLGNMSAPPTHPELLDWLAATFVESGWSIKSLHRLIVLSAAYRQSGETNAAYAERDPDNRLLWRFNLRRLDFEQMHDSLLAITGELDLTRGGRPVPIASSEFAKRRAIYTMIDRGNPPELLTQFDFPNPDVVSGRRYETLVPQQALFLMNSPMVIETARKLVEYPGFAAFKSDEERVKALYIAIYQRMPTAKETELGLKFVKANPTGTSLAMPDAKGRQIAREQRKADRTEMVAAKKTQQGKFSTQVGGTHENAAPLNAWTKLAHALFQSNEAIFYN